VIVVAFFVIFLSFS